MSNVQIPNLPVATSLGGNEELEIVQGGVSRRTTTQAIADLNPPQGTVTTVNTAGGLSGGPITTTGTIQIAGQGVDNTKLATMPAYTVKGRNAATTGSPGDVTMGELSTMLGLAASATTDTTNASNITSGQLSDERYYLTLSNAINRMVNLTTTPFESAMLYLGPDGWTTLNAGIPGQILRTQGTGFAPEWFTVTGTGTVQQVNTGTGLQGGPITTIGTVSIANTGVTAGNYGATNQTLIMDVNAQGQITNVSENNIAIGASQVTSGSFGVTRGGTGITSYAVGDLIYASGTTTLAKLVAGTADYVLTSNGTGAAPSYKQINLSTAVTGTLGVANGGTGATTLTGYVKGSGTSAFTASATIPNTDITGLGTMSTQSASSVNITGGTAALTSGSVSAVPVSANDLANKSYVDSVAQGLAVKQSVVWGTTGNITLSGLATQAGGEWTSTLPASTRILVKNQTNPNDNGIYAAASGAWTRTTDADVWNELVSAFVFVQQGATLADTGWVCTADPGGTIGTNPINWTQFSGAGAYTAGAGLTQTGTQFSLTSPVLTSLGGTGTTSSFTSGSVVFATTSGVYSQNNANFFWDNTNARLGLGTNAPGATLNVSVSTAVDAVRITQTGSGNALVVEDSANPDSTPFVIDANGRVIVGNTAGVNFASGYFPQIQTLGSTQSTSANGIGRFSADAGSSTFSFVKSRSATVGSYSSIVSSGDGIGTLQFFADDGTATPINAAQIQAAVDGTPGTGDMPGRLTFWTTADGASSPTERMRIDNAGRVGLPTAASGITLRVNRAGDAASYYDVRADSAANSSTTTLKAQYYSVASTSANGGTPYTVTTLAHYQATAVAFNADSTVTNQYGFLASSPLTGATNNYGFYGSIPAGTGDWNFYAAGTAANYFEGDVTANSALTVNGNTTLGNATTDTVTITATVQPGVVISGSSAGDALRITQTGAGNALVVEDSTNPDSTPFVVNASGQVLAGTTSYINAWNTSQNLILAGTGNPGISVVQASNSTAPGLLNFAKSRATTPGDWTTIVQSGDIIGQINFLGADGTTRVNAAAIAGEVDGTPGVGDMPGRLVFSTTADGASTPTERMRIDSAGQVGIGTTPSAGRTLSTNKNVTGATGAYVALFAGQVQSDVTASAFYIASAASTAATSFTLPNLYHFVALQSTFGAGSTVTNQFGFHAGTTLTGATNNYGFYGNIPAGTGDWNFYANGTANNYFNGNVGLGTATTPAVKLVVGSTDAIGLPVGTTAQRPTPATGYIRFNSDLTSFEGYNGTSWTSVGGGATGGGSDKIFIENGQVVTTNYTITTGNNAGTFGPVTINSGVTVTVPSGSVWTVV